MGFVAVGDLEIWFETAGEGPRLLFIGGTGGDLRQKPNALDGPFVRRFEMVAYDQRGLGRTSKPDGPYSMAQYADDAAGLLDALGWDRAHVVGVSFGGMVAQELALRHGARVDRLVLACTSSGGAGGASYPLETLADLPIEQRAIKGIEINDIRHDADWRSRHPKELEPLLQFLAARARVPEGDPALDERALRGAELQIEARSHHDTFDRLPQISAPTLVCGGSYDGIAPVSNQRALASRIPNAELELFEGGHMFLIEDRRAFRGIIEFLERTS